MNGLTRGNLLCRTAVKKGLFLAFFPVVASSQILPHLFHGKDNAFPAYKKEFQDLLITELFFISVTVLTISYLLPGYVHFCCSSSGKNGNILSNGDDTILPFLSIEEADLGNNVCSGSIVISQIMTPGEANTSAIVSFNTFPSSCMRTKGIP